MIILGLILLAAAIVAAVELVIANDDAQVAVHMWKWDWTVDAFWLAVVGAAILAVALVALVFLRAGSKRGRRLRRERRELRAENRRLAKQANRVEPAQEPLTGGTRTDQPAGAPASDSETPAGTYPPADQARVTPGTYPPADQTRATPGTYSSADQTRATPGTYPPAGQTGADAPTEGRHLER